MVLPIFIATTLQLLYCDLYFFSIYMKDVVPSLVKGGMLFNIWLSTLLKLFKACWQASLHNLLISLGLWNKHEDACLFSNLLIFLLGYG
jgi:hypothetical protein